MKLIVQICLCLLSGFSSLHVFSAESVKDFHTHIVVLSDGSINVTETITVDAEGVSIQRGIYRDFPTRYKDRSGNDINTTINIVDIQRDGHTEPFHIEQMNNNLRVYIGDTYIYLDEGRYTYRINYTSKTPLGFFKDIDELYWNVTGNGWSFPIEKSSAHITLPVNFKDSQLKTVAYQGKHGSTESAQTNKISGSVIAFNGSRPLNAGDGLIVSVRWPAGFVKRPSTIDNVLIFIDDNLIYLVLVAIMIVLFIYYKLVLRTSGIDTAN